MSEVPLYRNEVVCADREPETGSRESGGSVKRLNQRWVAVQRFRGGLVFKAHILCVPLNSRLERNKEEKAGTRDWNSW